MPRTFDAWMGHLLNTDADAVLVLASELVPVPAAQREAKQLALRMSGMTRDTAERTDTENAALIARLRVSPEGQEGLSAFLDKRKPNWIQA